MPGGIIVVGVLAGFLLRPLFATIAAVHVFVMVEVVVLVFIGVLGGHIGGFNCVLYSSTSIANCD